MGVPVCVCACVGVRTCVCVCVCVCAYVVSQGMSDLVDGACVVYIVLRSVQGCLMTVAVTYYFTTDLYLLNTWSTASVLMCAHTLPACMYIYSMLPWLPGDTWCVW